MKLSKASWIILSIGAFIVVIVSLSITRYQQLRAQDQLDEELSMAEMRLEKLQVVKKT